MKTMLVAMVLTLFSLQAHAEVYTFDVPMKCKNCSDSIQQALSKKYGESVTVQTHVDKNKVVVDTHQTDVAPDAIKETIAYIGFDVSLAETAPSK
jgi:copper chaperone CopZ